MRTLKFGNSVGKELQLLHDIESNIVSAENVTTAQQTMASLAFKRKEMLPAQWGDKSESQLRKRLTDDQYYAMYLHKNPRIKKVYMSLDEFSGFVVPTIFWLFVEFLTFVAPAVIALLMYFSLYFSVSFLTAPDYSPSDASPLDELGDGLLRALCWGVSFIVLTVTCLKICIDRLSFRLLDLIYHILLSCMLSYFAFGGVPIGALNVMAVFYFIVILGVAKIHVNTESSNL